jgi:hypothetical protein
MENSSNIFYLLLGDLISGNLLHEIQMRKTAAAKNAKDIFNRMTILKDTNTNLINQRNKIPSNEASFFYFYITDNFIFIFLECDIGFNSSSAFKFIEGVVSENVHLMTNDLGELNNNGKIKIKALLSKYHELKGGAGTSEEDFQLSVRDTEQNLQTMEGFKGKNMMDLKHTDLGFVNSGNIRGKNSCRNNAKTIVVITIIVIILLVVIILPIVLSRLASSIT